MIDGGLRDRGNLRIIVPGGVIGIEALLFGIDRLRRVSADGGETHAPAVAKGLFWSSVSGFTSFISHAGGPPILQYLLPQGMDRVRLEGSTAIYIAVVNFSKLLPYGVLGLLDVSNATISLALLPVAPVGYWLGLKLLKRLPPERFNLAIAVAMLLTGLKLVIDSLLI